jgi:CDP-glucose 4,6-dehydratase
MFSNIYKNKKIFLTGHTGFKGSWMALWLNNLGAELLGYSLKPNTEPNHFSLLDLKIDSIIGDIRNLSFLKKNILNFKPDIVFHFAAQPLVRQSYKEPVETFETNIIGTINVLEACKYSDSVKAIVIITSDKCYENKEWIWGYRENDPIGGFDPYSASKACAELVTASYRNSFFNLNDYGTKHTILIASARAGNVIGGGDWSNDRLIPDIIKAAAANKNVIIRNPNAIRPWQHVLEPLSGYLLLGQKLLQKESKFAEAWNFGPNEEGSIKVKEIVKSSQKYWQKINYSIEENPQEVHEATLLKLDCSKAFLKLNWRNIWDKEITFKKVIEWYKEYYENKTIFSNKQLKEYISDAKDKNISWSD